MIQAADSGTGCPGLNDIPQIYSVLGDAICAPKSDN